MAARFPQNFNDGEHCLPVDFFFNPHLCHDQLQHQHHLRQHLPCMDDFAHQFTALSLLRRGQIPHNFELQRFKPPVQSGTVSGRPTFPVNFGTNGGRELGTRIHKYGTGSFSFGSKAVRDFQLLKQTPTQLESYVKDKANRLLQRQQNRLLQQTRFLPDKGSGFGFNGGLLREYGGTGVFHPRINTCTTGHSTATVARKQCMGDRQKIQATEWRNSLKRSSVVPSKQEEYHLPPDMGLPRDWTY